MAVFMFMIGAQLVSIFLKGMLGLPFGIMPPDATVNYPVFFLALATLILVLGVIVYAPVSVAKYALLIGVLLGWGAYVLLFSPPGRMWHLHHGNFCRSAALTGLNSAGA